MIRSISFDLAPIHAGVPRAISVDADGDVEVTLWCYQDPPGQVVACGSIIIKARATALITPDRHEFSPDAQGELVIRIVDTSDGDMREITISVIPSSSAPSSSA